MASGYQLERVTREISGVTRLSNLIDSLEATDRDTHTLSISLHVNYASIKHEKRQEESKNDINK